MSGQNEMSVAVYNALTGSTALTTLLAGGTASQSVFQDLAPEGATAPYVVYQTQSPSMPQYVFSRVAYENTIYAVRGVTQGPSKAAGGTIAAKIDAALNDATLTVSGYTFLKCRRLQDIDYGEIVAGVRVSHIGGAYRVWAQP